MNQKDNRFIPVTCLRKHRYRMKFRYCLDPDNDPIRDQMIREFPDDVTTR